MPFPCAESNSGAVWREYHDQVKSSYWGSPAHTGAPARGAGLEYRACLGCGSHLCRKVADIEAPSAKTLRVTDAEMAERVLAGIGGVA